MTTESELIALAGRVEAATGPDRELDAEIALALGIVAERDGNVFFGHKDFSCLVLERSYYDIEGSAPELFHYTASLDAAMTLLDAEAFWQIGNDGEGPDPALFKARASSWHNDDMAFHTAVAETAPLALTAAALRARAAAQVSA